MPSHLQIDDDALAAFCRKHRLKKLSLFGSVLRDDFVPGRSDVDVLIEFQPGADERLTYFGLFRMGYELEEILGHPVDLSLADSLDPLLRNEILGTAREQYVQA